MSTYCAKDNELVNIISEAELRSLLARTALANERHYHQHLLSDQHALLQQVQHITVNFDHAALNQLQENTLIRITHDLQHVNFLNDHLKECPASDKGPLTWSLKTNKMENILNNAYTLLAEPTTFSMLAAGNFPQPFANNPDFPILLGSEGCPHGTSKLSYLSAALVELNLTLLGENAQIQDLNFNNTYINPIDESAILHVTPLPPYLSTTDLSITDLPAFSFYYSDENTSTGLAFIHSGYAFGGQRGEEQYSQEIAWGPEDCSTWVAKITGSDYTFSTIDQLFTYRMALSPDEQGYIDPEWQESKIAETMQELYTPIKIEDPRHDIQPGQVMAFRTFEDENHMNSAGLSGHTGIVMGMRENGNVVIMAYARNMPDFEGFGIQEFPWQSTANREMMYFKVNFPLELADVLQDTVFLDETGTSLPKETVLFYHSLPELGLPLADNIIDNYSGALII